MVYSTNSKTSVSLDYFGKIKKYSVTLKAIKIQTMQIFCCYVLQKFDEKSSLLSLNVLRGPGFRFTRLVLCKIALVVFKMMS